MPQVRLRPMREDEWDGCRSGAIKLYADDMMRANAMPEDEAKEMTIGEFERLLADGLRTTGHHLLVAADAESDEPIGYLWYGPRSRQHDAAGVSRIELNVFGDNERARQLYETVGYTEMARQMAKNLDT